MCLTTRIPITLVVILLLALPGLTPFRTVPLTSPTFTPTLKPESSSELCTRAVAGITNLPKRNENPYNGYMDNPARVAGDFDVNTYFTILERLQVQPGFALDYVWFAGGIGGQPILYTHPTNTPPYRTYGDYAKARGIEYPLDKTMLLLYLEDIVVEDSTAGYLEFAILRIMGDQFYLDWHANYNDQQIICDSAALEHVIAGYDKWWGRDVPMPDNVKEKARRLDTTPTVTLAERRATVSLLTFTKWGGFIRVEYAFDRNFPHRLVDEQTKELVPFDCGIMF